MNPPRANFARGFTLLELILVMVLIAVIMGLATPALSRFSKGRSVGDSADRLLSLARYARTQSISRGIAFRLNVDPSQGAYWLTMQNGPSFENLLQVDPTITPTQQTTQFDEVGEEYGQRFTVPEYVTMTCNVPTQPDGQYLEFRPSGRCDPGSVTFTDSTRTEVEVGCLAATEQWHVLSDEERRLEPSATPPPAQTR